MTGPAYERAVERLTANLPNEHRPWPFGMPTSIEPRVVIIGASPGNSPERGRGSADAGATPGYAPPTYGRAHQGFYYRDTSHYWVKVRNLCLAVVHCYRPGLSEDDALAYSGHFNLGTGSTGTASICVVEPGIVTWLSGLLGSVLPVRVVVGVGLNALLRDPHVVRLWNDAPGGLRVDWSAPQRSAPFQGYRFRLWEARRADGESVLVCLWPNHPSRNPFTGPVGPTWLAAVDQFCGIVRDFQEETGLAR